MNYLKCVGHGTLLLFLITNSFCDTKVKEKSASSLVPSQSHEKKIMRGHIVSRVIHPVVGCPMIVCRLVSASHLNGELGKVKVATYDDGVIFSVEVHFEKKGAKSTLVKPENLRIVFDLPKR